MRRFPGASLHLPAPYAGVPWKPRLPGGRRACSLLLHGPALPLSPRESLRVLIAGDRRWSRQLLLEKRKPGHLFIQWLDSPVLYGKTSLQAETKRNSLKS